MDYSWKNIVAVTILLLFLGGAYFTLREEYAKQLASTDSKFIAMLKAINEYVIKDLLTTLVGVFLILIIGIFVLGGVIGLMIFGWKELLIALGLIALL